MGSLQRSSTVSTQARGSRPAGERSEGSVFLEAALARVPVKLCGTAGARFPLLEAVQRHDPAAARSLMLAGALAHRRADERSAAEYLLRHRDRLSRVGPERLLASARCAVEMELRHARRGEVLTEPEDLARQPDDAAACRTADPSAGELVVAFAAAVLGEPLPIALQKAVRDAVVTFMELAARHARFSDGLSLVAMRPSARADARLVTHLRRGGWSRVWSRRIARLLIGADGSAPDTALVWWVARGADVGAVPVEFRLPWVRDLRGLIATLATSSGTQTSDASSQVSMSD